MLLRKCQSWIPTLKIFQKHLVLKAPSFERNSAEFRVEQRKAENRHPKNGKHLTPAWLKNT